jgi:protein ImuA
MSPSAVRTETIEALRRQLISTQRTQSSQQCISTGLKSLDDLLPGGGLPTSALIEWISDDAGQSAASIALRSLHADAARSQGIPLSRLLLVRPQHVASEVSVPAGRSRFVRRSSAAHSDALWALEQAARCPGVRAVLYWLDRSSSAVMRRLQLAVERSGCSVVLIRPASVLQQPSFADLRLHVQTVSQPGQSVQEPRVYSVRLLRSRHGLQHEGRALLCQGSWQESIGCQTELQSPRL